MVEIFPFRSLRYSQGDKNADISDFICPPYDVISTGERGELIKNSPENVVQLELPEGEGDLKYTNAENLLRAWRDKEILQMDRRPSFYVLETTYRIDDPFAPKSKLKRYGVLTALRLEVPGKGSIRPHEKTLPKAKEDRLKLVSSVRTNISPIFGLFFDKKEEWKEWLAKIVTKTPLAHAQEKKDLDHRMWKVDDPELILELQNMLKKRELYIADGHHRYEVAWAYKDVQLQNNPAADLWEGWQNVMTYICPMRESGLLMLPTHRLIKSKKTVEEWREHLSTVFELVPIKKTTDIISSLSKVKPGERKLGFLCNQGMFMLEMKEGVHIDRCLAHRPDALRVLDVILLHDIALGEAPGIDFLQEKEIEFTRNVDDMVARTASDPMCVGFLLPSPGVESLAKVSSAGEVMPPKTTYFYPKVPTGFTLMPLDQRIK